MNIWRETRFRRSGRTTRMLCAAVATALWKHVVVIGANAAHTSDLQREFWEKADRFSVEVLSPTGYVSNVSMLRGWLGGERDPEVVGGEPFFENDRALAAHLKISADFLLVDGSLGFRRFTFRGCSPEVVSLRNSIVFIDHYAEEQMVEEVIVKVLR